MTAPRSIQPATARKHGVSSNAPADQAEAQGREQVDHRVKPGREDAHQQPDQQRQPVDLSADIGGEIR